MNTPENTLSASDSSEAALADLIIDMLSVGVDHLIVAQRLPISLAEALDDLGNAFQRAGERIMQARASFGLPLPDGPDD